MDTRLKIAAAIAPLLFAACGTQDIDPKDAVVVGAQAGPDVGGLIVAFAATEETIDAARAANSQPAYHLLLDGKVVAYDNGGGDLTAIVLDEGGAFGFGYLNAGPHHFTIVAQGSSPVFEADGEIMAAGTTHLFLYGPLNGLGGRFVMRPDASSAGNAHVTAINLMRSGQTIEVVSCTDATTCTSLSPALALGDLYDADVPALGGNDPNFSLTNTGAGIGYRIVPSATLPAPPVLSLHPLDSFGLPGTPPPADFLAAPIFMTDQGEPLETF